jgi:predicted acetyltransferase
MENSHSTSYKKDLDKLEFGGNKFMALKLMKGSLQYKNQIIEMIKEWKSYNDTHDANTSPWAIFKNDYDDFEYYLNNLEISTTDDGFVPDSTFFCLDEDRDTMVGAVNIRNRAGDKKILELCREHQYSHKNLQNAIRIVYEKRHIAYEEKKAASA